MSADAPAGAKGHGSGTLYRLLRVFVHVEPREVAALIWAWVYFFCVLSAYYVIRPIRDDAGVAGGISNLPWLYVGTLGGMALLNPPFAAIVSRWPRSIFVPRTYRFFVANLITFFVLLQLTSGVAHLWVGRMFFVWTSVFNMFVVSIFWATMVDLFTAEQGTRLFGFIAAGATVGAITGSTLTAGLVTVLGPAKLLIVSAGLLELAVQAFRRLSHASVVPGATTRAIQDAVIGGGTWDGLTRSWRSPYLLQICLYMLLFTTLQTFVYFQQAALVDQSYTNGPARTQFFATVDLGVNVLTLIVQVFLTSRIIQGVGVAYALTVLPAITVVGFVILGAMPTVAVIVAFQIIRRATEFALARPTRELLYSVVAREDKYKAKSFIDTFVYRAGDQVGAWSYTLMGALGLGVVGVAWIAVPLGVAWLLNGLWLGRHQERVADGADGV